MGVGYYSRGASISIFRPLPWATIRGGLIRENTVYYVRIKALEFFEAHLHYKFNARAVIMEGILYI